MNQTKDGVLTLVRAFSSLTKNYPSLHLIFAGNGNKLEKDNFYRLVCTLNLAEKVQFIGRIDTKDIPEFLQNSKLLASCRQNTFQNKYSFPTKVIEYLASGRPTVTTAPGELAFYLKDKVNAYISKSDDPNSFYLKMDEALQEYEFALKVGERGKHFVMEKFDLLAQVKTLLDFCNS